MHCKVKLFFSSLLSVFLRSSLVAAFHAFPVLFFLSFSVALSFVCESLSLVQHCLCLQWEQSFLFFSSLLFCISLPLSLLASNFLFIACA